MKNIKREITSAEPGTCQNHEQISLSSHVRIWPLGDDNKSLNLVDKCKHLTAISLPLAGGVKPCQPETHGVVTCNGFARQKVSFGKSSENQLVTNEVDLSELFASNKNDQNPFYSMFIDEGEAIVPRCCAAEKEYISDLITPKQNNTRISGSQSQATKAPQSSATNQTPARSKNVRFSSLEECMTTDVMKTFKDSSKYTGGHPVTDGTIEGGRRRPLAENLGNTSNVHQSSDISNEMCVSSSNEKLNKKGYTSPLQQSSLKTNNAKDRDCSPKDARISDKGNLDEYFDSCKKYIRNPSSTSEPIGTPQSAPEPLRARAASVPESHKDPKKLSTRFSEPVRSSTGRLANEGKPAAGGGSRVKAVRRTPLLRLKYRDVVLFLVLVLLTLVVSLIYRWYTDRPKLARYTAPQEWEREICTGCVS